MSGVYAGALALGILAGVTPTIGCWLSALIGRIGSDKDVWWTLIWVSIISVLVSGTGALALGLLVMRLPR